MQRREFLKASAITGVSTAIAPPIPPRRSSANEPFRLKYAPHFGMFQHHAGADEVAQLEFIAGEGFRALEDNWMARRAPEQQEKIAKAMARLGLEMGVFVASAEFGKVTFAANDDGVRERIRTEMQAAVECAKRVNARWCTVVPGNYDPGVEPSYQTANVVENLKRAAEICEPAGLVMVLEALNPWRDHPGLFLTKIPQAYQICRAVGSPSCKILDDLYHQQVTEGNLIPNIDRAWSEIAYFQVGDNPGRREPGTGEVNFRNVFRHIHEKGFTGVVGMEHGKANGGVDGERALIAAYRTADAF